MSELKQADAEIVDPATGATVEPAKKPAAEEYTADEFEKMCDADPRLLVTFQNIQREMSKMATENAAMTRLFKAVVVMNQGKPVIITKFALQRVDNDARLTIRQDPAGRGIRITSDLDPVQNTFLGGDNDEKPVEQVAQVSAANGENGTPATPDNSGMRANG